jgi:hypothetical protein
MSGRPVVVLGGWLGCQKPLLRRYEELYRRLGFDVMSYIASPQIVVGSTFYCRPIVFPDSSSGWPATAHPIHAATRWSSSSASSQNLDDMQQLAWLVLSEVHRKQPHSFLYHGFSNGGCFLWEQIIRILDEKENRSSSNNNNQDSEASHNEQQLVEDTLSFLRHRLKGVVFDSCPAWFEAIPSGLRMALQHCSWSEKLDILIQYGPGAMLYDGQKERALSNQRCRDFFRLLYENSSLDISELYLYSEDDQLSSFEHIDKLVHHRKSLRTKECPVGSHCWKQSQHCAHLRMHPEEYARQIEMFTVSCLRRAKL